jgi:hypothetical protein
MDQHKAEDWETSDSGSDPYLENEDEKDDKESGEEKEDASEEDGGASEYENENDNGDEEEDKKDRAEKEVEAGGQKVLGFAHIVGPGQKQEPPATKDQGAEDDQSTEGDQGTEDARAWDTDTDNEGFGVEHIGVNSAAWDTDTADEAEEEEEEASHHLEAAGALDTDSEASQSRHAAPTLSPNKLTDDVWSDEDTDHARGLTPVPDGEGGYRAPDKNGGFVGWNRQKRIPPDEENQSTPSPPTPQKKSRWLIWS